MSAVTRDEAVRRVRAFLGPSHLPRDMREAEALVDALSALGILQLSPDDGKPSVATLLSRTALHAHILCWQHEGNGIDSKMVGVVTLTPEGIAQLWAALKAAHLTILEAY